MTQIDPIAIAIPLLVGVSITAVTIIIHALSLSTIIHFVRHERRLGRAGTGFLIDVTIIAAAVLLALTAHLIEIAVWAALFAICGQFPNVGTAIYHSAVNYTTLGYGEVAMSGAWRLLAPLEAADGMLMFGVSTAMIFAVIQRLVYIRFQDD
jgi:Ion channel